MRVDFHEFIAEGVFGDIEVGTPWARVVEQLGEPDLYEPPGGSSPGFARYGDLELTIRGDTVAVVSLQVDGDEVSIPAPIAMTNFEDPNPDMDEVAALLKDRGLSWNRLDSLCDEQQDAFRTERGVHLSFGDGLLGKIGAADPKIY